MTIKEPATGVNVLGFFIGAFTIAASGTSAGTTVVFVCWHVPTGALKGALLVEVTVAVHGEDISV
jgi:hypothetical protein